MRDARAVDPRDPRFLPFRGAIYAIYFVAVIGFSLLVVRSLVVSLRTMSPPTAEPVSVVPVQACEEDASSLFRQLDEMRQQLALRPPVAEVDVEWAEFRTGWMRRYREIEARCGLEQESRKALRETFTLLLKVLDLYTTHAVQFAGEVGPTIDKLRKRLPSQTSTHGTVGSDVPPERVTH